jgi:hypothetical protein
MSDALRDLNQAACCTRAGGATAGGAPTAGPRGGARGSGGVWGPIRWPSATAAHPGTPKRDSNSNRVQNGVMDTTTDAMVLDGEFLTVEQPMRMAREPRVDVRLDPAAMEQFTIQKRMTLNARNSVVTIGQ